MTAKLQNVLHWILVVALTLLAITPSVVQLFAQGKVTGGDLVTAIVGVLVAAATKFVYYANTVQGTTATVSTVSNSSSGEQTPPPSVNPQA